MASARRTGWGKWLLILGRVVLGVIFLFAAYGKLRPYGTAPFTLASLHITHSSLSLSTAMFAMQVDAYQILPPWAVNLVANTLPWFELGLAVLLLAGIGLRWVALVATGLVAAFFGMILHSYFAGLQINCGCFGPGAEPLSKWTILRDGLFLALALAITIGAFLQARSRRKLPAGAATRASETAPAD